RADQRADVLHELGSAERLTLAAGGADHLREALALMKDPRRQGEAALELGRMLFWSGGRGVEAVKVFERAIAELDDADPDLRQRSSAWRSRPGSPTVSPPASRHRSPTSPTR